MEHMHAFNWAHSQDMDGAAANPVVRLPTGRHSFLRVFQQHISTGAGEVFDAVPCYPDCPKSATLGSSYSAGYSVYSPNAQLSQTDRQGARQRRVLELTCQINSHICVCVWMIDSAHAGHSGNAGPATTVLSSLYCMLFCGRCNLWHASCMSQLGPVCFTDISSRH